MPNMVHTFESMSNPFSANVSSAAAERLLKSADTLDFALAANQGTDKRAVPPNYGLPALPQSNSIFTPDIVNGSDFVFSDVSEQSAILLDEWAYNDVSRILYMSAGDASSDSSSPTLSSENGFDDTSSPGYGFDSITSDSELIMSPTYAGQAFFNNNGNGSSNTSLQPLATNVDLSRAMNSTVSLTPQHVQQAAAALNIPWTKSLEDAILAQGMVTPPPTPTGIVEKSLPLNQSHSNIVVSTPAPVPAPAPTPTANATALTAPSKIAMSTLAFKRTPVTFVQETGFSGPEAKQKSLLNATGGISSKSSCNSSSSATYKSFFRTSSLGVKRDRDLEDYPEPPSVLEGKDVTGMDEVSLKRAKNTDAARRSRRKKLVKMESLEKRVMELELENEIFETKLNETERERLLLQDKEMRQRQRIEQLEHLIRLASRLN